MSWTVRILDDDEDDGLPGEPPEPEEPREPAWRRLWPDDRAARAALAVAAVIVLGTITWLAAGGGAELRVVRVGSYWDDATLACRTAKLTDGRRSLEAFRCRPTTGIDPPAGRYERGDGTVWQSDVDRRTAVAHDIVITGDGIVSGWAAY